MPGQSSSFWRVARGAALVAAAGAVAAAGKVGWERYSSRPNRRPPHPFRLKQGERTPEGIRGVLDGQVERAMGHLEGRAGEPPEEAVHEARKSFKRSRATLRLARGELGPEAFAREDRRYRDLGRELAGVRDADVLIATLDGIATRAGREGAFAGLRKILVADRDSRRAELLGNDDTRSDALDRLAAARAAIPALPLERKGYGPLIAGLRRSYRDGRSAAKKARKTHDTEALHEWRKRVKDLWHQCQVLTPLWPKRMKAMAGAAHDLSDLLGEDHDLAVLAQTAREHRRSLKKEERRLLERAVRRRRKKLQRAADRLGARLYAERPRKLAARLRKHARSARP